MTVKTEMWDQYLASVEDAQGAERRFYESFRIGNTEASGNEGAALILQGVKTATSSLLWAYLAEEKPLPEVGSLSVVENGRGEPVCIVETTDLEIKPFNAVDAQFAYEYGEWDRALDTWQKQNWAYYSQVCKQLGREAREDMPLVCERFQVVYPFSDLEKARTPAPFRSV